MKFSFKSVLGERKLRFFFGCDDQRSNVPSVLTSKSQLKGERCHILKRCVGQHAESVHSFYLPIVFIFRFFSFFFIRFVGSLCWLVIWTLWNAFIHDMYLWAVCSTYGILDLKTNNSTNTYISILEAIHLELNANANDMEIEWLRMLNLTFVDVCRVYLNCLFFALGFFLWFFPLSSLTFGRFIYLWRDIGRGDLSFEWKWHFHTVDVYRIILINHDN